MLDRVKKVARWSGPAVALLMFHMAVWGVPTLPVSALLVGIGVVLSWGVPWLVQKLKGIRNR